MAKLVLLSEGFTGRTFELKGEKMTVGRVPGNDIEIPESSVSSHHAEILLRGKDVVVKDLSSTNGSFIDGERITEAVIKPGHLLRLGTVDMRLETGEPPPPPKKLDQTRVIPQGVKLQDLEAARTPLDFQKPGFEKKSNRLNTIWFVVLGLLFVALAGVLIALVIKGTK
jgi:hypothetical protein